MIDLSELDDVDPWGERWADQRVAGEWERRKGLIVILAGVGAVIVVFVFVLVVSGE